MRTLMKKDWVPRIVHGDNSILRDLLYCQHGESDQETWFRIPFEAFNQFFRYLKLGTRSLGLQYLHNDFITSRLSASTGRFMQPGRCRCMCVGSCNWPLSQEEPDAH